MGGRRVPLAPKESMGLKRWTEAHREGSVLESQTYIRRGGGRVKPLYKIKSRRRMVITSALEGNRRTRAAKTTSTIKMYFNSKGGKMTEKLEEKQGKQQVCNTGSLMQPDKRTDRWAERLVKEEVSDKWTMWPM